MNEADIERLISSGARESRELEFKLTIYAIESSDPKIRSDARRELFGDLIAMANSGDGTVILGIEEADEVAIAAPGVLLNDATEFVKKLPELLLRNIAPPLRSVEAFVVSSTKELLKGFVVINVRLSTDAPHRDASTRIFYERLGAQRSPMDISRVRTAFLRGELAYLEFDEFRKERLATLRRETPANASIDPRWWGSGFPVVCIHAAPLHALSRHARRQIDFRRLDPRNTLANAHDVDHTTYNAEGFLRYTAGVPGNGGFGFQVFHAGMYECISAGCLWRGKVLIRESDLVRAISQTWAHLHVIEGELNASPWLVSLSAWGLHDATLGLKGDRTVSSALMSSEVLLCPEVRIDRLGDSALSFGEKIAPTLQPLYTAFRLASVEIPLNPEAWKN